MLAMYLLQGIARLGQRVYLDFTHDLSVNTIGDTDGHLCNPEYNIQFDDKWYEYIATENDKRFGCSVPWHPRFLSKRTGNEIEICRDPKSAANAATFFLDHYQATISEELTPCARYDVSLGMPHIRNTTADDTNSDKAFLKLYFKTNIKQKSTVIYYDSTTFAAEIGGYVGMFLGISLIDITIILNSFLLIAIKKVFG